jgi:hypothetical protein
MNRQTLSFTEPKGVLFTTVDQLAPQALVLQGMTDAWRTAYLEHAARRRLP